MKRLISLLLTAVMLIGMIPLSTLSIFAADGAVISIQNVTATAGSTVDVTVSITGNPGIATMGMTVTFDEALTLIGAKNGEAFSDLTLTVPAQLKNGGAVTDSCIFAWFGTDNVTDNGVILTLTFRVSADAAANRDHAISVNCDDANNDQKQRVSVSAVDGAVKVINYIPGDVDSNGSINMLDVLMLCQYYVDGCRYNPNGYGVNINALSGDVDASGNINMMDVLLLCQYYVDGCKTNPNGYNVTLRPGKVVCAHSTLTATEAKPATCTEDGNIAYWHCADCGKYFSDAACKTEIALSATVVEAGGHDPVTDEAVAPTYDDAGLTEGSHCGVCGEILVAQQPVSPIQPNEYSITYVGVAGATNDNPTTFTNVSETIALKAPQRKGYDFLRWEDESGKEVIIIASGTSHNVTLVAKWQIKTYTITLDYGFEGRRNIVYDTFTVEDEVTLPVATEATYVFVGWKCDDHYQTKVERGTARNLTFKADWRSSTYEGHQFSDIKTPKYDKVEYKYDENTNVHTFLYYLGYIDNVPTYIQDDVHKFSGVGQSISTSTTTKEENRISNEISTSTTKTREWTNEVSVSYGGSVSASAGIKLKKLNIGGEQSRNWNVTAKGSVGESTSTTVGETSTKEYVNSLEQGKTVTYTFTADNLNYGWYRFVSYATVDVFAVIEYDAKDNSYSIGTIEAVRSNGTEGWEYSPQSSFDELYEYPTLPLGVELSDAGLPMEVEEYVRKLQYGSDDLVYSKNGSTCTVSSYTGTATDIVIPEFYVDGNESYRVVAIDTSVFKNNESITSVSLGSGITGIAESQFEGCSALKQIILRGTLDTSKGYASLTEAESVHPLSTIGAKAFMGCVALEFEMPSSVKTIGDNAFKGCASIRQLVISSNVTSLGSAILESTSQSELHVMASSLTVAAKAAGSKAKKVLLSLSQVPAEDKKISVTLAVPADTEEFTLVGAVTSDNKLVEFTNLAVDSYAAKTTLQSIHLMQAIFREAATEVVLNRVNATKSYGATVEFKATDTMLYVDNTVDIGAVDGDAVKCDGNLTIQNLNGSSVGNLTVSSGWTSGSGDGRGLMVTNTLTLQGRMNVIVTGGRGWHGTKGSTPERSGTGDGGTGSNGRMGGVAIKASTVNVTGNVTVVATGGQGGNGGNGGNSVNKYTNSKNRGGKGGNGGQGGTAIEADYLNIDSSTAKISAYGGQGGNGGNGGFRDTRYYNGDYGPKGSAGAGGAYATITIAQTGAFYDYKAGIPGSDGNQGGSWQSQDDYYDSSYWVEHP